MRDGEEVADRICDDADGREGEEGRSRAINAVNYNWRGPVGRRPRGPVGRGPALRVCP